MNVYSFYHWISRKLPGNPVDSSLWPPSWKTIYFKVYEGANTFPLSKVTTASVIAKSDVRELLLRRRSHRNFTLPKPFTELEVSSLLGFACGERESSSPQDPRRVYPSGGARYPIEVYLLLRIPCGAISAGVYHYRSDLHALEELQVFADTMDITPFFTYQWAHEAVGAVLLTDVFSRTTKKYGERGYRFSLLEAGGIAQNISLVSEALGRKAVNMGGTRDAEVENLLGIDGHSEALVHALMIG